MDESEIKDKIIAMRNGELKLRRDGVYWTEEERKNLEMYFQAGMGISAIAVMLERSESAIYQQIGVLNLQKRNPDTSRQRTKPPKEDGCLCKICTFDRALCPRCEHYPKKREEA